MKTRKRPQRPPKIGFRDSNRNRSPSHLSTGAVSLLTDAGERFAQVIWDPAKRTLMLKPVELEPGALDIVAIHGRHLSIEKARKRIPGFPASAFSVEGRWNGEKEALEFVIPEVKGEAAECLGKSS
jgi:hypothetical protein